MTMFKKKKKKKSGDSRIIIFLRKNLTRLYIITLVLLFAYVGVVLIGSFGLSGGEFVYMQITVPFSVFALGSLLTSRFIMFFVRFERSLIMLALGLACVYLVTVFLTPRMTMAMLPPSDSLQYQDHVYHITRVNNGSMYDYQVLKCDSLSIVCEVISNDEERQIRYYPHGELQINSETNRLLWLIDDEIVFEYELE